MIKMLYKLSAALLLFTTAMAPANAEPDSIVGRNQCGKAPAGVPLNKNGCPCDNDQDGVFNYQDRCPSTPTGLSVDNLGCRQMLIAAPKLPDTAALNLQLLFASDEAIIGDSYFAQLQKLVAFMQREPASSVVIAGHTDDRGSEAYNQSLSKRRADAVKQMMVQRYGADGEKITCLAYGEQRPLMSNRAAVGRQINRRVETTLEIVKE